MSPTASELIVSFEIYIIKLTASSGKRNITVWCPSVCLSVQSLSLTLIWRAAHIQRNSSGAAHNAASVHFRPSITRTDILVRPPKTRCRPNRTVPSCSVGRRTGHAPGPAAADRPRALQTTTDDTDRRQRQLDDIVQNNTGPLGGPVTKHQ